MVQQCDCNENLVLVSISRALVFLFRAEPLSATSKEPSRSSVNAFNLQDIQIDTSGCSGKDGKVAQRSIR